ncbi:DNA replication complex GINS protein PSF3 [Periplaneta americana]
MAGRSLTPHYFSLEDIFATQERVPCKFILPVPRLGFLDPSSESDDIVVGTSAELPFWLARAISSRRRNIVTIDIPKIYKEAYREILKADACVVDLHKFGLFFYQFGAYISRLNHRDSAAIGAILVQTFKERFRQVMDWAHNSGTDPAISQRLDSLERSLFREGHQTQAQLDAWLSQGPERITAAQMVVNHKKRKLADLEHL